MAARHGNMVLKDTDGEGTKRNAYKPTNNAIVRQETLRANEGITGGQMYLTSSLEIQRTDGASNP